MTAAISAIAWDIDGTLIDSEPLHDTVLEEVSASYGVDLSHLPENYFRGIQMPDVWKELQPRFAEELDEAEWTRAIIDRYIERASELRPLPGAVEAMRAFAQAGLKQVCVSNSGRRIVDANIGALEIVDLIEFSISLDDVCAGKPDPEPYLAAARRLGLAPETMAAVEDSVAGATSAHLAGFAVFGIDPAGGGPVGPAGATIQRLHDLPALVLSSARLSM